MFDNKILLITGGTGSFGNAVLRRFLNLKVKEISFSGETTLETEKFAVKVGILRWISESFLIRGKIIITLKSVRVTFQRSKSNSWGG